jgi:hypothetical protein
MSRMTWWRGTTYTGIWGGKDVELLQGWETAMYETFEAGLGDDDG